MKVSTSLIVLHGISKCKYNALSSKNSKKCRLSTLNISVVKNWQKGEKINDIRSKKGTITI